MPYTQNQFDCQHGYYGPDQDFGGQYIPEVLLPPIQEVTKAFEKYKADPEFLKELKYYQENLIGRPSPLIYLENLSKELGGAKIFLKNEGNNFTGSHKINHCIYHALLAKRMGKTRIICETGAGQHGVAVATVCAKFGFKCTVFMGQKSIEKQYPNVFWMKQLGAEVIPVLHGDQGLTEASEAAMGEWMTDTDAYFMIGSVIGPYPFTEIVREAQKIVGMEVQTQSENYQAQGVITKSKPDYLVACIGGGSNAIGLFNHFLYDEEVKLIGVEAGGEGSEPGQHASRIASGQAKVGIFEGFKSLFLTNDKGSIYPTKSISAGLDYSGIGPIHAYLSSCGRLQLVSATDKEVLTAFQTLAQKEGILPALESSHALVEVLRLAPKLNKDQIIVANLSGRADNYLFNVAKGLKDTDFETFASEWKI